MKYHQSTYYYDGYAAHTNNCGYADCQLKLGTASRLDWCHGWRDAEHDSRKKVPTPDSENTKDQFESLAASQQPAWDGEGFPPVGFDCEALMPTSDPELLEWRRVKVVHVEHPVSSNEILVFDIESTRPSWVDEFRPIRTEADRKREEAIKALNFWTGNMKAAEIYDAIAAGKIPGVKLEAEHE